MVFHAGSNGSQKDSFDIKSSEELSNFPSAHTVNKHRGLNNLLNLALSQGLTDSYSLLPQGGSGATGGCGGLWECWVSH